MTPGSAGNEVPDTQDAGVMADKQRRWKVPSEGFVKANWDAAINLNLRMMGIGVIIWDERGEVLAAYCDQKKYVQQPATTECMALWKAMELGRDLGFNRVIFEGDAHTIVKAVNEESEDFLAYRSIVQDAKQMLQQHRNWKVQFVNRNLNEVAHILAKMAISLETEKVWMEDITSCISESIEKDKECMNNVD
ncbi:uncharacterized protein LOC121245522 [Juglans microcarpa x Juglans regia]|uniref:uncharacterized protein LOC121240816 n=1 Tax=Juglans microcarpa x Juglans regia TaxID=2249226 RepID=UPI001B7ED2D9|nr:uncharacterized protein LOC121240816 [Juglans microcarpa x Juglans regia]XP_040999498.1 uncharacterized protein LOC121245522 [Juglans microcarpa x Juglans regia]